MHSISQAYAFGQLPEGGSQLVGVPILEPFESVSSWITRAALSQGVTVSELLKHLEIQSKPDLDINLTRRHIQHLARHTGHDPARFWLVHHMFAALRSIDPRGTKFLLFANGSPRYRYCPVCLHEQTVSHFALHWRFFGWRHCPLHNCMMEDRCKRCGLHVELPCNLMMAGIKRAGLANLHQCAGCEQKLSAHWESVKETAIGDIVSSYERVAIAQGRSVLSALFHGYFYYAGHAERRYSLKGLLGFERNGNLPHHGFVLDSNEILRRRRAYSSGEHPQYENHKIQTADQVRD